MIRLGVSLESVARLRAVRTGRSPDLLGAGHAALLGGADHVVLPVPSPGGVVTGEDLRLVKGALALPLHLRATPSEADVSFAIDIRPDLVTLVVRATDAGGVPGLALDKDAGPVGAAVARLREEGIDVSLSIAPDENALVAANGTGAEAVEIHTGRYATAVGEVERVKAYLAFSRAASSARALGLRVHAAGGLDYGTVSRIAAHPDVEVVGVGFAIAARALFDGFQTAVSVMRDRVVRAKSDEAPVP